MAASPLYYRFYIPEHLRKYLGITLRKKYLFIYKFNNEIYLSTDTIPRIINHMTTITILNAKTGQRNIFVDIPKTILDYEPSAFKIVHSKGKLIKFEK